MLWHLEPYWPGRNCTLQSQLIPRKSKGLCLATCHWYTNPPMKSIPPSAPFHQAPIVWEHCPPILIIPGPATGQLRITLTAQSPPILFKFTIQDSSCLFCLPCLTQSFPQSTIKGPGPQFLSLSAFACSSCLSAVLCRPSGHAIPPACSGLGMEWKLLPSCQSFPCLPVLPYPIKINPRYL